MIYIKKIKEYRTRILFLAFLIFTNISTYVSAQGKFDTSTTGAKAVPVIGNLGQKTLQQLVADFILLASGYVLKILLGFIVLTFLYGLMKYMFKGQGSDTARTEGRKLMLWGIIGIFVVTSVWGLVSLFTSFVGHDSIVIPQFK